MGLDTTHECWHGPYSSFHEFRRNLCKLIGLDIEVFCGYNNNAHNCTMMSRVTIPHDIYPLINHSDCDGVLLPHECESIADGLDLILNENLTLKADNKYLYDKIIRFRDGCREAFENNETVKFY